MSLEGASSEVSRLRAAAHPLRLEMLSLLTGGELSAAEVARELETTQANASYHLRVLLKAGLLEAAGEEKVNGGIAKRYRALWDRQEPRDPKHANEDADAEIRTMAEMATIRVAHRKRGVPGHFTDAALWVEPEVWRAVLDRLADASRLMHESARPPRSAGSIRANLSVLAFRLEEDRLEADR
jgi:DNA-binding transcriptional ArsR family regulator